MVGRDLRHPLVSTGGGGRPVMISMTVENDDWPLAIFVEPNLPYPPLLKCQPLSITFHDDGDDNGRLLCGYGYGR